MAGRLALWRVLVERGLAASEREARALCLAGEVLVAGRRVDKAGTAVDVGADVAVRGRGRYASRGGEKLAHALRRFGLDAAGRVALDCGASTGGFTDCLLAHGAARVYAVDVGFGQLLGRLRQDPRVVNMERTNLGDVAGAALQPPPTLVTLDLSYLSLAQAWQIVAGWLPADADVVSLVKPLFEIDDPEARRTGVIAGAAPYVALLERLGQACADTGWTAAGLAASPIRGSRGTVEFLMHSLARPGPRMPREWAEAAVHAALAGEG